METGVLGRRGLLLAMCFVLASLLSACAGVALPFDDDGSVDADTDASATRDAASTDAAVSDAVIADGAADAVCAASPFVGSGTTLPAEHLAEGPVVASVCRTGEAHTRYYRVHVPPAGAVRAVATPSASSASVDLALSAFIGCTPVGCAASSDVGGRGASETVRYVNGTALEQVVTVAVSGTSSTDVGDFALQVDVDTAGSNTSCVDATSVADGAVLTASTEGAVVTSTACLPSGVGPMVFYRATIPAGSRLLVTSGTTAQFTPPAAIRIFGDCAQTACLASATGSVQFPNNTPRAIDVFVGVGNTAATPTALTTAFSIGPAAMNVTCGAAQLVHGGDVVTVSDPLDSGSALTLCGGTAQRPRYFHIQVPGGSTLTATANVSGSGTSPTLRLVDGCSVPQCLVPTPGGSLSWRNSISSTVDVFLVASPSTTAPGAAYSIRFGIDASSDNSQCASASRLVPAPSIALPDLDVSTGSASPATCGGDITSVRYWLVSVAPGQRLDARLTTTRGTPLQTSVRLLDTCTGATCLGSGLSSTASAAATWTNNGTVARDVVIAAGVDGSSSASVRFSLVISMSAVGSTTSCANATTLDNTSPTNTQSLSNATQAATTCSYSYTANALFYRVTIPAGQRMTFTATSSASLAVRVLPDCGATTCLAQSDYASGTVRYTNTGTSATTVVVAVGATYSTASSVTASVSIGPAPAEGGCATAVPLAIGTARTGSFADAMDTAPACNGYTSSAVRSEFFRVDVPAGQELVATVSGYSSTVRVLSTCASTTCLAGVESDYYGDSIGITRWANRGAASTSVIVAVSGGYSSSTTYSLTAALRPIAAASTCGTAPVIADGTMLANQEFLDAGDAATTCGSATQSALYYRVDVPAGKRVVVRAQPTVTSTGGYPTVRLLSSCSAITCVGRTAVGSSSSSTSYAAYINTTGSTQTLYAAVSGSVSSAVSVAAAISDPPADSRCSTAPVVTASSMLTAQSPLDAQDPAPACTSGSSAAGLFYAVDLPAGQRLVASSAATSVGLRITSSCGAATCLATSTGSYYSGPVVAYTNSSTAAQRVFVVATSTATTAFDLRFVLDTPPARSSCATAPALASGVTVSGISIVDSGDYATTCSSSTGSQATFHRITVPAGQRVDVVAATTGSSGSVPFVRILSSCSSSACLANSTYSASTTRYSNTSTASQDLIIAVTPDSYYAGSATLSLTATLHALPANAQCSTARVVADGTLIGGEHLSDAGGLAPSCGGGSTSALFYSVVVPAGSRVTATASVPTGYAAPFLRVITTCTSVSCAAMSASSLYTSTSSVTYTNSSTESQTVYIAASSGTTSSYASDAFDLSFAVRAGP